MSLLSSSCRMVVEVFYARSRRVSADWAIGGRGALGVLAAIVAIPGVGAGLAHAQECDPVEVAKLLAADGAGGDEFGTSVSISGDTLIVGAAHHDDNGSDSGAAYVYTRSGGGGGVWTEQAKLLPDDGATGDEFGFQVSISGDTALIGAWSDDDNGSDAGSAYVFTRSGGVWTQQAELLASDGAAGDWFGVFISLDGDTALIGASYDDNGNGSEAGAAYVFTRDEGVWTQQAKLLASDGAAGDWFGRSLSLSGDILIIGAWADDDFGSRSGSAYVFTRSGDVWTEQAKLLASDGAKEDTFGYSVSIDDDIAIIGAIYDDDNGSRSGSTYVFARSGDVWTEQAKLLPADGAEENLFGYKVSLLGDTVVIGAWLDDDNGSGSGSAYVFSRDGNIWTEQFKLLASDGAAGDRFSDSISFHGDTVVIGAVWDDDDDTGSDTGSAYVFDLNNACLADLTGDCEVDTIDFLAFLGAWSIGDSLADWNGDGDINTLDFLAYLADWVAGCP